MTDPTYLIPLSVLISGWMLAGGSPGPATLTISGTAMGQGRGAALLLASGVVVGSATWGIAAALGFSALMVAHVWLFELVRYAGAGYLFYLAVKSLLAAWKGGEAAEITLPKRALFTRGLLLHLTNPKAILSWGSVYAIALPAGAGMLAVWQLFGVLILASMTIFWGYALLFSAAPIARFYARTRRWFQAAFGILFGAASLKILTLRVS